jgi:hypothetical protein
MLVSLLKIELLSASEVFDSGEFYNGMRLISGPYLTSN